MDVWEAETSTTLGFNRISTMKNKWEGEDVEECIMDSWDQEPEEQVEEPPKKNGYRRHLETDELNKKHSIKEQSIEEIIVDKLEKQKLQDLEADLVEKTFGVIKSLDTKEDFDELNAKLLEILNEANKNSNYASFVEELVQKLCIHLSSTELKKICIRLGNLQIQKINAERGEKKKTKAKLKAKLRVEGNHDYSDKLSAYTEYCDDFI